MVFNRFCSVSVELDNFVFSKNILTRKVWLIRGIWQVAGMSQSWHNLEVIPLFRINLLIISEYRRVACIFCSLKKLYVPSLCLPHIYRDLPLFYSPCFWTQDSSPPSLTFLSEEKCVILCKWALFLTNLKPGS